MDLLASPDGKIVKKGDGTLEVDTVYPSNAVFEVEVLDAPVSASGMDTVQKGRTIFASGGAALCLVGSECVELIGWGGGETSPGRGRVHVLRHRGGAWRICRNVFQAIG